MCFFRAQRPGVEPDGEAVVRMVDKLVQGSQGSGWSRFYFHGEQQVPMGKQKIDFGVGLLFLLNPECQRGGVPRRGGQKFLPHDMFGNTALMERMQLFIFEEFALKSRPVVDEAGIQKMKARRFFQVRRAQSQPNFE